MPSVLGVSPRQGSRQWKGVCPHSLQELSQSHFPAGFQPALGWRGPQSPSSSTWDTSPCPRCSQPHPAWHCQGRRGSPSCSVPPVPGLQKFTFQLILGELCPPGSPGAAPWGSHPGVPMAGQCCPDSSRTLL